VHWAVGVVSAGFFFFICGLPLKQFQLVGFRLLTYQ